MGANTIRKHYNYLSQLFDYALKHSDVYGIRKLNACRYGLVLIGAEMDAAKEKWLAQDLDTISFEMGDYPPFPLSAVHFFYKLYIKIVSLIIKFQNE